MKESGGPGVFSCQLGLWEAFRSMAADDLDRSNGDPFSKERERFFRSAFEFAAIGMALVSPAGRFLAVNRSLCELCGYSRVELLALDFQTITHPEDLNKDLDFVKQVLAKEIDSYQLEKRYFHKDGRVIWVLLSVSLVCNDEGKPWVFISQIQDLTARKKAEEDRLRLETQIQQAQKLESLGVLAGGIAHDFNNLLVGILGNASLALEELSQTHPVRGYVQQIETAAMRAADLTKQMLAYSGKGRFIVQRFSITEMVEEMANLLQVSIPKNVVLKYLLDHQIPPIEADVTQIRQVTMNLIINAAEAIQGRSGIVTIATGQIHADDEYLKQTYIDDQLGPGHYAYLEVSDTGCGMDQTARERLFEPFFTTKTTGRGLGLAAVLGIVRGHRGAIKCYSELGRGTTFKVLFPIAAGPPEPLEAKAKNADKWLGSGLILVVDDEKTVRDLAARVLQKGGFDVLLASNGREAIDIYRERRGEIRLVLLDMMMPRLSGEETFRELRKIEPNVRVVLSSGYNEQETTNQFAGKGLAGFVQKPYRSRELLEKVRAALQESES